MAKLKMAVGDENVGDKSFAMPTLSRLQEIEQFIFNAGSDHVPTFGGQDVPGSIQCQQAPDELAPCLLNIMESGEPIKNYLEIGVAAGGTTFLINHFLKPEKIVLIDDNQHPKAHIRGYILTGIPYTEIIGHSQSQGALAMLQSLELTFDMIMIDGGHTYEEVKADVKFYKSYLRDGGFLLLHDSSLAAWGVMQVVEELKKDKGFEFVEEYKSQVIAPLGLALFRKAGK